MSSEEFGSAHENKPENRDNGSISPSAPTQNPQQQYTDYGTPVDAPVHDPYTPPAPFSPLPDASTPPQDKVARARRNRLWVLGGLFVLFLVVSLIRFFDMGARPYSTPTPRATIVSTDIQISTTLRFNQTVSGTLGAGRTHNYTFEGRAGELVTLRVDGEGVYLLDTVLTLSDSDQREVARDDDGGGGLDPLLCNVQLPVTGQYTASLSGYDTNDTGVYDLTLERGLQQPDLRAAGANQMVAAGNFPGCDDLFYQFDVAAGDTIHVLLESESGTLPEMILADAAGNLTSIRASLPTPDFVQNSLTAMPTVLPLSIATRLPTYLPATATALGDNPRLEITTDPVSRNVMYTLTISEWNQTTESFSLTIDTIQADGATPVPTRTLAPGAYAETTPEVTDQP